MTLLYGVNRVFLFVLSRISTEISELWEGGSENLLVLLGYMKYVSRFLSSVKLTVDKA